MNYNFFDHYTPVDINEPGMTALNWLAVLMTHRFYEAMNARRQERRLHTYLKIYREKMGLSQRELAEESGVPFRTIQQYEQRQKNINHARAEYVVRLSSVLGCATKDLMEC